MPQAILSPMLALVLWTFVIWVWMYATRIPAMNAAGIDPGKIKQKGDLDVLPVRVKQIADNYNHLHEQPVLFYALCTWTVLGGAADHEAAAVDPEQAGSSLLVADAAVDPEPGAPTTVELVVLAGHRARPRHRLEGGEGLTGSRQHARVEAPHRPAEVEGQGLEDSGDLGIDGNTSARDSVVEPEDPHPAPREHVMQRGIIRWKGGSFRGVAARSIPTRHPR